jgi:large subunit ribosomal protein L4
MARARNPSARRAPASPVRARATARSTITAPRHTARIRAITQRISKTVKKLALARAIFERVRDGEVDVIERFELPEARTKAMTAVMAKIDARAKRVLIVDEVWNDSTILASRNIARLFMAEASDVNALDFSDYDRIVVSIQGMDTILARLGLEQEAVNA